uniref:Putative glycosyltransferase n=1 Tax=viral metagenome TaxID=1070528 RepID=A0A6M3L315_9ZZZZ
MSNPRIAVVVSCYNHERFAKECLESIAKQTYDNFFVYVFDNNSSDRSRITIGACRDSLLWAKEHKFENKYLMLDGPIFTKGVLPIGVARWLMVQRVIRDCDWFAIIDADDKWDEYKLEYQVKAINDNPEAKLCFSDCHYLYWHDEQVDNYPAFYRSDRVGKRTFNDKYPPPKSANNYFDYLLTRYNFMPCPTLMFNSKVFKELIVNPSHYTSAEDYDWALRFTLNYPAVWVKNPLAYYRVHKDQLTQKTPAFCTAEEIDVIRRVSRIMNPEKYSRMKNRIRGHLIYLYSKLMYKEVLNELP